MEKKTRKISFLGYRRARCSFENLLVAPRSSSDQNVLAISSSSVYFYTKTNHQWPPKHKTLFGAPSVSPCHPSVCHLSSGCELWTTGVHWSAWGPKGALVLFLFVFAWFGLSTVSFVCFYLCSGFWLFWFWVLGCRFSGLLALGFPLCWGFGVLSSLVLFENLCPHGLIQAMMTPDPSEVRDEACLGWDQDARLSILEMYFVFFLNEDATSGFLWIRGLCMDFAPSVGWLGTKLNLPFCNWAESWRLLATKAMKPLNRPFLVGFEWWFLSSQPPNPKETKCRSGLPFYRWTSARVPWKFNLRVCFWNHTEFNTNKLGNIVLSRSAQKCWLLCVLKRFRDERPRKQSFATLL